MTHSIWKRQLKCDGPPVGGLGETGGLQVCTANYIEIGHASRPSSTPSISAYSAFEPQPPVPTRQVRRLMRRGVSRSRRAPVGVNDTPSNLRL